MTGPSRKLALSASLDALACERRPFTSEAPDADVAAYREDGRLAAVAQAEYAARRTRDRLFGMDLFAEPAWDMLLDLYIQRHRGRQVSIHSLCIAAAVPQTTALRWINKLDANGLVVREPCQHDNRVIHASLSAAGTDLMERYLLGQLGASGAAAGPQPTLS
ncbi:winged helix DNA-binding protein [Sphingopyxis sp.]|uniref:winged helix DNA-binding protein n=1 Tax=Sphingopyxis sp. TaxID=1908224 RepID=UPI003BA95A8C